MHAFANVTWELPKDEQGRIANWTEIQVALLMDIRNELRQLNEILRYRPPDTGADNLLTIRKVADVLINKEGSG